LVQKNILFSLVTVIGSKILSIFALVLLSRVVAKEQLAIFNALINAIESTGHIILLGTNVILCISVTKLFHESHYKELFRRVVSAHIWICIVSGVALLLVVFFKHSIHSLLLGGKGNPNNLYIVVVAMFFYCLGLLSFSVMLGLGKFKQNALRTLFISILFLVIIPSGFYFYKIAGGLFGIIFYYCLTAIFSFFYIRKELFKIIRLPISVHQIVYSIITMIKEGFLYFLGHNLLMSIQAILLTGLIINQIDLVTVTHIKFAASICTVVLILPSIMQSVSTHFLTDKSNKLNSVYFKALQLKIIMLLSLLFVMICLFFSEQIITLLFSARYLAGNNIISFHLLCSLAMVPHICITNFLAAEGRLNTTGGISVFTSIVLIFLSAVLIPQYQLVGYFISISIFHLLNLFLSVYFELRYSDYTKHSISFLVFIFTAVAILSLQTSIAEFGVVVKLIFVAILIAMVSVVAYNYIFHKNEKVILRNLISSSLFGKAI
jgi:O-antigen/teichoic acid export membrane protein